MIYISIVAMIFASGLAKAGEPLDLSVSVTQAIDFSMSMSDKSDCKHLDESGKFEIIQSYCEICAKVPAETSWRIRLQPGTAVVLNGKPSKDAKTTTAAAKVTGYRQTNSGSGLPVSVEVSVTCGGSAAKDQARLRKILSPLLETMKTSSSDLSAGKIAAPVK